MIKPHAPRLTVQYGPGLFEKTRRACGANEDSQAHLIKKRAQVFSRIRPNQCLGDNRWEYAELHCCQSWGRTLHGFQTQTAIR